MIAEKACPLDPPNVWELALDIARCLVRDWRLSPELAKTALIAPLLELGVETQERLVRQYGEETVRLAEEFIALRKPPAEGAGRKEAEERGRRIVDRTYRSSNGHLPLLLMADHHARLFHDPQSPPAEALARETAAVYLPLAQLLGMWHIRRRWVERIAPRLVSQQYKRVQHRLGPGYRWADPRANHLYQKLVTAFRGAGLHAVIRRRPHLCGSTAWRSSKRTLAYQGKPEFHLTLLVICRNERDCYQAMAIFPRIRGRWTTDSERDLLANGQPNGYRALRYRYEEGNLAVEVQVVTPQVHLLNEWGIVACQRAPQRYRGVAAWWNVEDVGGRPEGSLIEVFSPRMDRQVLEMGATPLDFAYAIHVTLGHRTIKAEVNGRSVPLDYQLKKGDIVEVVEGGPQDGPDLSWLSIVRTNRARSHIKAGLVELARPVHPGRGEIVRRVVQLIEGYRRDKRGYRLALSTLSLDETLREIAVDRGFGELHLLYEAVHAGHMKVEPILARIVQRHFGSAVVLSDIRTGITSQSIAFCEICRPVPGDELDAYLRRRTPVRKEVIVHAKGCRVAPTRPEHDDSRVAVAWAAVPVQAGTTLVSFHVVAQDRTEVLDDVLKALRQEPRTRIRRVSARALDDDAAEIEVSADVNQQALPDLLTELERTWGTRRVTCRIMTNSEQLSVARRPRTNKPDLFYETKKLDRSTFYGRAEQIGAILHWLNDPVPHNPLVVRGEPRSGKSTLLHYLTEVLLVDHERIIPVNVDLHFFDNVPMSTLASYLVSEVYERLGHPVPAWPAGMSPVDWMAKALDAAGELLLPQRLLLVLDEFSSLKDREDKGQFDPHDLDNLYTVIERSRRMYWVVSVLNDRFFEWDSAERLFRDAVIVRVTNLEIHWARKFVVESFAWYGLTPAIGVAEQIVKVTAGNPYLIKLLCNELVDSAGGKAEISFGDLDQAILNVLGAAQGNLMHFISELSPCENAILKLAEGRPDGLDTVELSGLLQKRGSLYSPEEIRTAVDRLMHKGVLNYKVAGGSRRVRFAVELVRRWSCLHLN